MARAQLGGVLREIRIHLCQTGETSKGVREFLNKHYVDLKSKNKNFPILVRECSGVQPRLWGRYAKGKESSVSLINMGSDDVLKQVEAMARKS